VNRITYRDIIVFALLVAAGAGFRLLFRDLPNFAPVAALALFSGYFFRSKSLALCVPLATMAISDLFIGAYTWQMMALVYGMLMLPAFCGGPLRKAVRFDNRRASSAWRPAATLLTCSLGASFAFFFATNFGAWIWFDSYSQSWSGLVACYAAAIPFFRYTLAGDMIFAVTLFGSYAVATQVARRTELQAATSA
jgi:hypothetical protein